MSRQGRCDESVGSGSPGRSHRTLRKLKILVVVSLLSVAAALTHWAGPDSQARDHGRGNEAVQQQPAPSQPAVRGADRFDNKVRESFFSGFAGDAAALYGAEFAAALNRRAPDSVFIAEGSPVRVHTGRPIQ